MRKKLTIISILLCLSISVAACGGNPALSTPSENSEIPEENSNNSATESSSLRITYEEDKLPTNTPEHQGYVDKYISPYAVTGLFARDFGPENKDELKDGLMTMFDALRQMRGSPTDEELDSYNAVIPQDVVESILTPHFDLTPEQIREYCSDYYHADQQAYHYLYGLGGGPAEFVVTGSLWDGDMLTLSYDWYGGDDKNPTDTFRYALIYQGKVQIKIDGNNFKFISNAYQKAPGND